MMKQAPMFTALSTLSEMNAVGRGLVYIVLVIVLASLLSACSAPYVQLSDGHVSKIKTAFIGREFVFLTDWHYGMVVHKGQPMNNWYATFYNTTKGVEREKRKLGKLVARSGEVARITEVTPLYNYRLYFTFKTNDNKAGNIIVLTPNNESWGSEFYQEMTDEVATLPWINDQLTRRTIKFLDAANQSTAQRTTHSPSQNSAALPEPPPEINLTPATVTTEPVVRAPSITQLKIAANPPDVRNDEVLRLNLNFEVDAAKGYSVQVKETRTLLLDGEVLPGYPKTATQLRQSGHHSSVYEQKIPARARVDSYLYRGEVCIDEVCINRETPFRVVP